MARYFSCLCEYVTIGLVSHNRAHVSQSQHLWVKPKRPCTDLCTEPVGVRMRNRLPGKDGFWLDFIIKHLHGYRSLTVLYSFSSAKFLRTGKFCCVWNQWGQKKVLKVSSSNRTLCERPLRALGMNSTQWIPHWGTISTPRGLLRYHANISVFTN